MLIPTQQLPLLTPAQEEDEARYLDMITRDIERQRLHFSVDFDLTHHAAAYVDAMQRLRCVQAGD
ncbi:hypothetical protein PINS_up020655 [Pythium insidiosum]|nr:hypothetical protein PINS_up020655 [Pythium insidiosum]